MAGEFQSRQAAGGGAGGGWGTQSPTGVYWQGADGKVYVSGANGTNAAGTWDANTQNYWGSQGYQLIPDPVNFTLQPATDSMKYNSNTGGGTTYTTYEQQQAAEKAARQNAAWDKVNAGKGETFTSARNEATDYLTKQQQAARDFAKQYGLDIGALNNDYAQAELGKNTAYSGIMDMINRGITSAGTMLSNRNATNSSAAEQFAKLYSNLGQREAAGVEQDYQLDMSDLGEQYGALQARKESFEENVQTEADLQVNEIVNNARNALLTLNEVLADADIGERLQVEQLKEQVRQEARNALKNLPQYAKDRTAGVDRWGQTKRITEANRLRGTGAAGKQYDYTANAPMGMASSGVASSSLPLYSTLRARNRDRK